MGDISPLVPLICSACNGLFVCLCLCLWRRKQRAVPAAPFFSRLLPRYTTQPTTPYCSALIEKERSLVKTERNNPPSDEGANSKHSSAQKGLDASEVSCIVCP